MTWTQEGIRFLFASFGILFVSFLVPGFSVSSFFAASLTVTAMTALYWILDGLRAAPFLFRPNALSNFSLIASLLYASQWIVPSTRANVFGALIAASLIMTIQAALPEKMKYWRARP